MTENRQRRGQGPNGSAESGDSGSGHESPLRAERRLLVPVLVFLILVLCVLIWLLVRSLDSPPVEPGASSSKQPLLAVTGPGKGYAPRFSRPLSAAWAPNGDIYVSDTGNGRICVFTTRGRFVREFGSAKSGKSNAKGVTLQQPAGIAVGPDRNVYVADVHAGQVVVFDSRGRFVKQIRPRDGGEGPGGHWAPTDVAVTGSEIFVTDAGGVAVFSADGSLKSRIETAGVVPFSYPNGVAVRPNGALVVSDTNHGRVVSMEESGTVLWVAGPADARRRTVGLPRGLAVAKDGSTLVADAFLFGIQRLSDQGVVMEGYGDRGAELGHFAFPNDVDVLGNLVLVADKENNRVQVIRWPGLANPAQQ